MDPRRRLRGSLTEPIRRLLTRHAGLRPTIRMPRWAAGFTAAAITTVCVVLAVAGVPKPIGSVGDIAANLGRNLLTGFVLGGIAYLWFFFWTSDRATRKLREAARRAPERLFPVPPRIGTPKRVVGREHLIDDVVTSLRAEFRTGPQVIVGETGSGKTSFLLGLASRLACEHDVVPIVLTLRDLEEIDFTKLAKDRFAEYIDAHIRSDQDAEKLWRWMRRRGRIVVLADDLDRVKIEGADSDPYKGVVRSALEVAKRRELPLVVASRPEGVPPGLEPPPIELPRLELTATKARDLVLEWAGRGKDDSDAATVVDENIADAIVVDNAFYLGLLAYLLRARRLAPPPDGGEHAVRVALLGAWRDTLLGDETVSARDKKERDAQLEALERFAGDRLAPLRETEPETEWLEVLHAGERFGLIHADDDGRRHRFSHDVVHAYFASRALIRERRVWERALELGADAPRVQLALALAAAQSRDAAFCRDACSALLDVEAVGDEPRLLRIAAAAEIARAGGFTELDDRIATELVDARRGGSSVTKRAAVAELASLGGTQAMDALWEFAGDDDYQVRWEAVETLVRRCSKPREVVTDRSGGSVLTGPAAYDVLSRPIEDGLARAEPFCDLPTEERPDDWVREIVVLKHMAWMLPALESSAQATDDAEFQQRVAAHLDALLSLEERRVTAQRGLEASLAQGFKVAARLQPHLEVDSRALLLLDRAAFWYSQINLVHAIAARLAPGRDPGGRGLHTIRRLATEAPHPYVRATAKFCVDAAGSDRAARLDDWIWDDEGVLVSRRPDDLALPAIQLVGDITVLLNLNETGNTDQRRRFGERNDVPYCMRASRSREELFGRCRGGEECDFDLCPFHPASDRLSAHREISRAFCRHQVLHARARVARRWDSRVRQGALREFWGRMEAQARI